MWSLLQNRRHGKVILLTTHFMDEADILADRKAVVSKGRLRCCGSSLFLKNKFGIGYHLTLVLDGTCREHAITRLVTQYVPKAEKARRHGRELSFILPHNAVDNFAPLFCAIEQEINNRNSRLGISSYGVSMTTLEEVFLHLEREDEVDCTMDNLSKKMVRNRALSRSLSLQSKSTSYQSLQNESSNNPNQILDKDGKGTPTVNLSTLMFTNYFNCFLGIGGGGGGGAVGGGGGDSIQQTTTNTGCLEIISETKSPITGLGFEKIETKPNFMQTLFALLRLRILRMLRDIQKLYFLIALPLALATIGLYLNSIQSTKPKTKSLPLNGDTYGLHTTIAIHNATDNDLTPLLNEIVSLGGKELNMYDGNFSMLLDIAPHMAALNINIYQLPKMSVTAIYNDTMLHSLPIIVNFISNALYR